MSEAMSPDSIVIRGQGETAVYRNNEEGVVIRQQAILSDDEDEYVIIRPENLGHLIRALWQYVPEYQQAALKRQLPPGADS